MGALLLAQSNSAAPTPIFLPFRRQLPRAMAPQLPLPEVNSSASRTLDDSMNSDQPTARYALLPAVGYPSLTTRPCLLLPQTVLCTPRLAADVSLTLCPFCCMSMLCRLAPASVPQSAPPPATVTTGIRVVT